MEKIKFLPLMNGTLFIIIGWVLLRLRSDDISESLVISAMTENDISESFLISGTELEFIAASSFIVGGVLIAVAFHYYCSKKKVS